MRETIRPADESKPVINANGERVGYIVSVEADTALVEAETELTETLLSMLGWAEPDAESDHYTLDSEAVDAVTDDYVRLTEL